MGIYTSCHFQIRFSNNTHTIHLLRRVNTFACQRPFNNRETTGYNTFRHSLSPHKPNTLFPNRSQGFPRLPAAKRNHESPALRKSLPSHPQLHQHLSLSLSLPHENDTILIQHRPREPPPHSIAHSLCPAPPVSARGKARQTQDRQTRHD